MWTLLNWFNPNSTFDQDKCICVDTPSESMQVCLFVVAFVSGHSCIHHHPAQGKESASSKIALSVTTLQR